jgi:hypothetical protein
VVCVVSIDSSCVNMLQKVTLRLHYFAGLEKEAT